MAGSSFESEFLQTHNAYRSQHGAPPLTVNKSLCRSAQAWAEHLLSINTLKHSNKDYGENLYYAWSSVTKKLTGREAVESWYNEIKDYSFSKPGFCSKTGHFTQVVWKDTKELGVGLATDGKVTFVVGQYLPAGNITNVGYFERNVLPAGSKVDSKPTGTTTDKVGPMHGVSNRVPSVPRSTEISPSGGRGDLHVPTTLKADSSFESEFLQAHNAYRSQHGAPPLTVNKNLCRSAQAWAEHLLSINTLKHSNKDYGENLYYAWSSVTKKLTGREAVESWYNEIKDYSFSKPGFCSKTGHFTQVVWKDTKELGVGLATDGKVTFVVGQYLPAGNITNVGYFERNVLPAGSKVDSKPTGTTTDKVGPMHGVSNRVPSVPRSTEISPSGGRGDLHVPTTLKADSSFEAEFLQAHNAYRKHHGAPPLTINKNLCCSSQEWAKHLLSIRTLKHSNGDYGENVYYAWSSADKKLTGREAVESWYSEIKDYSFSRPGFSSKTGHFTQVVWKDTKELGVGLATDGNTTFVVGQYLPAGNISNAGYFERNVLPAGSKVDFKSTPSADRVGQALGALSIKSNQLPSSSHSSVPAPCKSQSPQSCSSEGEILSQFRQSLLEAQNDYRRQHGARPLSLCPILSKEAQDWATHLISINALKNSGKGHGETMSYKWTSNMVPPTGKEVAESWYKENVKYNFATPGFQNGTGNFTQMIWRSTDQVGIGLGSDGKGKFITVAFYKPPGNITNPGYFQDNVKPAGR